MNVSLTELAKVVRSKNCSPFELTFDIILKDRETYRKLKHGGVVTKELIAERFKIGTGDIRSIVFFDPAAAIKITVKRQVSSGAPGDSDVYGAQQHAPLLTLQVPLIGTSSKRIEEVV